MPPLSCFLVARATGTYVRVPDEGRTHSLASPGYLFCNKIGEEPLLHFSPSKMSTTVDPQRTAQIREVLAQTLSPDAATRRTVSFVVRHISIDSIRFRHHIIQHIRFSRSNLSPHLFLLACCAYHCFTFATGRATSDRGAEGGRPPAGRPSHCRE